MRDVPTKAFVDYRITSGMKAVGNQCKDCRHSCQSSVVADKLFCSKLYARVSSKGYCKLLSNK